MKFGSALLQAALCGVAIAHAGGHHASEEERPFSQEQLDELERKWGTDCKLSTSYIMEPFAIGRTGY